MDKNTMLDILKNFDYDYVLTDEEVDAVAEAVDWINNSVLLYKVKELRSLALRVKHNTGSIDSLIDAFDAVIRGVGKP